MKKYLIFVLMPVIIAGCGSSKPLVSTDTKSNIEIVENYDILYQREQKILEQLNRIEKTLFNENITVTSVIVEYDTDKPVNPDTGKPPVKSETKTDITKNKQGETITSDKSTKSDENLTNLHDNSTVASKNNLVEKVKQESPKDPYRYRYIFYSIIAVIVIICIGSFFAVKNKWFLLFKKLF